MFNLAERFVDDWIEDNVKKAPNARKDLSLVDRLALKLENDAWEFGLLRKAYLEAVDGDSHRLVLSEVWKASDETSECEEAHTARTRSQSSITLSGAGECGPETIADTVPCASDRAEDAGPRVRIIPHGRMKPLDE